MQRKQSKKLRRNIGETDVVRQECEKEMFKRGELPERFTTRKLFGYSDKKYDQEYWERLERNWRQWKGK